MRLDEWLIKNNIASDLFQANGLIMSAQVLVNDQPVTKSGYKVKSSDVIRLRDQKSWVARSAEKLNSAIENWNFPVEGNTFVDFGASHGGFTQALLQRGAKKVAAVDVAYGIFNATLRKDTRVVLFERMHVCEFTPELIDFQPDYFVADLSFISLKKVLSCLKNNFPIWKGIALFKPQFELQREFLKKGIVADENTRLKAIAEFEEYLLKQNIQCINKLDSPLTGAKGNLETLFYLSWSYQK